VKLLFWERNGFVVWYKRLERERFKWPTHLKDETVTLTGQELNWLLDGYNLKAMQPHKALANRVAPILGAFLVNYAI